MCCRWDRSNRFLRCYPATAQTKRDQRSVTIHLWNEAVKTKAQWAAHFSQYRNCVFPIMPTELISLRKFICACCMCQHDLCDIICHGTMQWRRKSQWASSIFTAFHALMSSTIKNTGVQQKTETPENPDGSSHKCHKDKATQTCMNSRGPNQNKKWWENTRNKKWIWMTYSPTGM